MSAPPNSTPHLARLTGTQRAAVTAAPGPLLVLAGPGAGKTTCLIERLRYLVDVCGFHPARLCAVTFTNKAAGEIAHRLRETVGSCAEDITGGTLHRLCLDVLRVEPESAGLRPGFGIADEEYQRAVLRQLGVPRRQLEWVLREIGSARLRGAPLEPDLEAILGRYVQILRKRNLVDFDDILLLTRSLFREHPAIAARTAGRWDAMLVDEFQDVSRVQYEVIRRLSVSHGHVFAVGDDEQSIYSWTGADPEVLSRFQRDYGITAPIVLDQNHRCSRQIFEVARRLVSRNVSLFTKDLQAVREGPADVIGLAFPQEAPEAAWIIADILRDRDRSGRPWGDFAILYRKHRIGDDLEGRLLQAGIPCRLARGRAIKDDPVIAQVLASLRVAVDPKDSAALDTLAGRVLSKSRSLLDRVRARPEAREDFLYAMRLVAAKAHKSDPDKRKMWRFIYHAENLTAVGKRLSDLPGAVHEILSMGLGEFRNPLEEHAADLNDPREVERAVELADRIAETEQCGGTIWCESIAGLGFALRGMLRAADASLRVGVSPAPKNVTPGDLVLQASDAPDKGGLPVLLFKALQLRETIGIEEGAEPCVMFDVETTGLDVATCEIIEIGAVLVQDGEIVDRFQSFVRPTIPIEPGARKIHGWGDEHVADAPNFPEVWEQFRAFVGTRLLVAHNGLNFDIPVLRRQATGLAGVADLVFLDTYPLARSLSSERVRLEDLALRFGVPLGRSHHALDDAEALAGVYAGLLKERARRTRIVALPKVLDWLGLAIALATPGPMRPEKARLLDIARPYTLGRYSDVLELYATAAQENPASEAPPLEVVIERLGGRRLMERLRAVRDAADRYPQSIARLDRVLDGCDRGSLPDSLTAVLERVALSSSEGVDVDPTRVQLLTLHATKGLEFNSVYIVGVEDAEMPGLQAVERGLTEEFPEARRLLYVGMTRARDRLVMTRVDERFGAPAGGSTFLKEMGLQWVMP